MKKVHITLFICLNFIYSNITFAQDHQEKKPRKKIFYSIVTSVGILPQYEGSRDYRVLPLVNFSANCIDGRYLRVFGLNTEYNMIKSRKWNFGPSLKSKLNRNSSVSDVKIAKLSNINFALAAGLFGKYTYKKIDIKANYTHDISGVNNGGLASLEFGYNYRNKKIISRTAISTSFATSNYLDTYFGVPLKENFLVDLPGYQLKSGFKDVGINSTLVYLLNNKWTLGSTLIYNYLIDDVKSSPIVQRGSKHQIISAVSIMYRF